MAKVKINVNLVFYYETAVRLELANPVHFKMLTLDNLVYVLTCKAAVRIGLATPVHLKSISKPSSFNSFHYV